MTLVVTAKPGGRMAMPEGARDECRKTARVTGWVATAHEFHICYKPHSHTAGNDEPHRCWACPRVWHS